MMAHRTASFVLACALVAAVGQAFIPATPIKKIFSPRRDYVNVAIFATKTPEEEAQELLERVKRMRAEIAGLEGKSVQDVESEAQEKKDNLKEIQESAATERQAMKARVPARQKQADGAFLEVPETAEDQVRQAAEAVERAFKDGITRQLVRFTLMEADEVLNKDRPWPGGTQQMYRRAAGPLTRDLLSQVRAPTGEVDKMRVSYKPNITSQDIWDFDGSALITAEAATGPQDDVQALVLANTDSKYSDDILTIDRVMEDRLFILINPFWRDIDSWGFNIMAPNAKKKAQEAIFDRNYQDTYVLLQKSVRGEECIALKVYPYDWQMYAYAESEYWPYEEYLTHLGSSSEEPKSTEFTELLNEREEFKMSKNMRQMQRMMGKNDQ